MVSVDGYAIEAGDDVWVWSEEKEEFYPHTVAKSFDLKIEYKVPCSVTGYIGARLNIVYRDKPKQRPPKRPSYHDRSV